MRRKECRGRIAAGNNESNKVGQVKSRECVGVEKCSWSNNK